MASFMGEDECHFAFAFAHKSDYPDGNANQGFTGIECNRMCIDLFTLYHSNVNPRSMQPTHDGSEPRLNALDAIYLRAVGNFRRAAEMLDNLCS